MQKTLIFDEDGTPHMTSLRQYICSHEKRRIDRQRGVIVSAWCRFVVGSRRRTTKLLSSSGDMESMLWKLARQLAGIKPYVKVAYCTDDLSRAIVQIGELLDATDS